MPGDGQVEPQADIVGDQGRVAAPIDTNNARANAHEDEASDAETTDPGSNDSETGAPEYPGSVSDEPAHASAGLAADEVEVTEQTASAMAPSAPQVADSAGSSDEDAASPAAVLVEISPDDIRANPKNPRQVFDDDDLAELSESIKEFGLLQPIVVRVQPDGYELVMGERRLRAARLAGVDPIPVIVRQTDDDEMLRDALLENIHRVQLHPLEEAAAYQQLIDEFGVTHEELARRIKRSRPAISNSIRLLKLPVRVQNRVAAGVLSGSHARALLSLEDTESQEALATRIVAEGMSVRATEEAVSLFSGAEKESRRPARRNRPTAPALGALAEKLSDHFDTRALVQLGRSKGKIVVEFASIDDLERIIAMMAPPLATQRLTDDNDGAIAEQATSDAAE